MTTINLKDFYYWYIADELVEVPDEVAVVSFDNSYYSDLCPVRITSLAHEVGKLGRIAAQLLLEHIDGRPCRSQSISWRLIQKESG